MKPVDPKPVDRLLLGRPVRELDAIAAELSQAVAADLARGGRREIIVLITEPHFEPVPALARFNDVDVRFNQSLVVEYMAARYGFVTTSSGEEHRITSTERRIQAQLNESLSKTFVQALASAFARTPVSGIPADNGGSDEASPGLHWAWHALVALDGGAPHPVVIALDNQWSRKLEQCAAAKRKLAAQGHRSRKAKQEGVFQIEFTAQLIEITMTAADLQALKVGSVIPIPIGRAVALFNGAPMLEATVAEHQGKLQLTEFETLE